ncbi:hypothetical protein NDU88_003889 [Pleurodeles waltl]|uniref:Uncharacterized protein n=1 Tax=Pleurodeles waltl TaxID=8319 RepID=A0AAV7MWW9_PLEWA|nr:hypothetical protein NDU88_003889 [Pleurodeles waltl]
MNPLRPTRIAKSDDLLIGPTISAFGICQAPTNDALVDPSCSRVLVWWLPESARWLVMNNKPEVALRNLKRVALINGKLEEDRINLEVSFVLACQIKRNCLK